MPGLPSSRSTFLTDRSCFWGQIDFEEGPSCGSRIRDLMPPKGTARAPARRQGSDDSQDAARPRRRLRGGSGDGAGGSHARLESDYEEDDMEEEELIRSSAPKPNTRKKSLPNRQREPISPAVRRPVPPPRREPLPGVAISVAPPNKRGHVPVDYYRMDAKVYSKMRSEDNEFNLPGTATDICFHTLVQQDIYETVCLKINVTTPQKFINLEYFEQHPAKFGTMIRLVDSMRMRHALTLKCD